MGIFLSHTRMSNGYLPGGYAGDGYPLPSLVRLQKGFSSKFSVTFWASLKTCFSKYVDLLIFLKLMAGELMLPNVSWQKPCRDAFEVNAARLSRVPVKILEKLEGYHLVAEVLNSWGFSGSSCWLGSSLPSFSLMESSNLCVTYWSLRLV
jgi:hypothetical protein